MSSPSKHRPQRQGSKAILDRLSTASQKTARDLALYVLVRVDQEQAYSNLLLNEALKRSRLSPADCGLATEIVYGTVQRLNTLDYFLQKFLHKPLPKLEPWVAGLLRLSLYQLLYLQRVPEFAVIYEAVNIAKRHGHQGIAGMVNGVLRSIARQRGQLKVPDELPAVERLALVHSHPQWLIARWIRQFGAQTAEKICTANNTSPHSSLRVNTLRTDRDTVLDRFLRDGFDAAPSTLSPDGILIRGGGNMAQTPSFKAGEIAIQDESSQWVGYAVDVQAGMNVLDCCAAPGGKTTHMAQLMDDRGAIYACDVHPHKQELIRQQIDRLGITCVQPITADARDLANRFPEQSFDRILLDAPCSGFGVIRRKPDLKWNRTEQDIAAIAELQFELLSSVHRLLRTGGVLVYSTCTIDYDENEAVIHRFLQENKQFQLDREWKPLPVSRHVHTEDVCHGLLKIFPFAVESDGFCIARLMKTHSD